MKPGRIIVICIPLLLMAAWIAGAKRMQAGVEPHLLAAVPGAGSLEPLGNGNFAAFRGDTLLGYARVAEADGYGGPMKVAVGIDTSGVITGISIVSHKETAPYFKKILDKNFKEQLTGKSVLDPLEVDVDIDAVTGATLSVRAFVESNRLGARTLGVRELNMDVPAEIPPPLRFGWPEVILLVLFALALAGSYTRVPGKKPLKWISQILGLVFLGFVYCAPLTLTNVNSLLLGYLPDWRNQLYWYLLIVGVLLPVILSGQRPYCHYVCPFGAVQDCLHAVRGTSKKMPGSLRKWLRWFHGILVFGAIAVALYTRNPGLTSYEVFGPLFDGTGMLYQFVTLGVVLIVALFIARPWCTFLCPINGVARYIKTARSSFRQKRFP